ncbi:VanZ family protein [Anaerobacillus sp. 1_MG-2023]|uniref:VanZ family protein n=1 Tax=Bacillales TaxID=1385 RepID=UPI0026E2F00F|nr:VanZ family protein [Anaerobacillus sp. 1_MG-2023]MDO6657232.1 VanZ family protein [Anaerobacillus sp. 1_MG-2023]
MSVSQTIVSVCIQCWLGIGFLISCMAILTLIGHEPAPFIVDGVSSIIQSREFQYGPLTLSLEKNGELGLAHFVVRKLGHFFVYSFIALILLQLFKGDSSVFRTFIVIIVVAIFAVTDEFIQAFLPERTALLTDVIVDLAGCLHSVIIYKIWHSSTLKALA